MSRAALLRHLTDLAFGQMEAALVSGVTVTRERMETLLRELVAHELDAAEAARALAPPRTEADLEAAVAALTDRKSSLQRCLALREHDAARPYLDAALHRAGLPLDEDSFEYRLLLRRVLTSLAQVCDIEVARKRGDYDVDAPTAILPGVALETRAAQAAGPGALTDRRQGLAHAGTGSRIGTPATNEDPVLPAPGAATLSCRPRSPTLRVGSASSIPTFSTMAEGFVDQQRDRPGWKAKPNGQPSDMSRDFATATRLFCEALGDRAITEYSVADVESGFRDLLLRLPKSHGKSARDRRSLIDIVADEDRLEADRRTDLDEQREFGLIDEKTYRKRVETRPVARLGSVTVNKHLRCVARIFDHAVEQGVLTGCNPVRPAILKKHEARDHDRARPRTDRLPWGRDGLRRLFGTAHFQAGTADYQDPLFAAPLIAVLSGMRAEEVLQLQIEDVVTRDGVAFFDIHDGPGRTVKSESAIRQVPVHRMLIEAGFLDHIERLKASGAEWIFPDLKPGEANGRFSDIFSKTFTRYRVRHGLYDPQLDFHSLRKDANVMLREAGVPWAARARLLGHKITHLTDGTYDPEGESLKERQAYINRISPGFQITKSNSGLRLSFYETQEQDKIVA